MESSSTFRSDSHQLVTTRIAKRSRWSVDTLNARTTLIYSTNSSGRNWAQMMRSLSNGKLIAQVAVEFKLMRVTSSCWSTGTRKGSVGVTMSLLNRWSKNSCLITKWHGTMKGIDSAAGWPITAVQGALTSSQHPNFRWKTRNNACLLYTSPSPRD